MRVSLKIMKMAIVQLSHSEMCTPAGKLKVGDFVDTQWGLRPVIRLQNFEIGAVSEPFGV